MTLDPSKLCIGPAFVSLDGTQIGITPEEGFEWVFETDEVEFKAAQAPLVVARARVGVSAGVKGILSQADLTTLATLMDVAAPISDVLLGQFATVALTQRLLTLQFAGPSGKTRVLSATCTLKLSGTKVSIKEYVGFPFEAMFLGDVANNSELFRIEDTAGSSSPVTISSLDFVDPADNTETDWADADTGAPVDEWVQVVFDKAISPASLSADNLSLTEDDGNADVALAANGIAYGVTATVTDRTKVLLKPLADLDATTKYTLRVGAGLRAVDGYKIDAAQSRQFTTT